MPQSLILAIDQGGQSSRVGVYTRAGELLCCFTSPCATRHRVDNGVEFIEQDPLEILQGIRACLKQVEVFLGADAQRITAAGFAGQGSSLLCWNRKTGEAISPVLSWQDVRGQSTIDQLALSNTQAQQLTGLRVSPHYGASKIKWCLEHNPQVCAALTDARLCVGPIASYIFCALQGFALPALVDPGHAQRTLLWNLHSNHWEASLLSLFDIPENILPQCLYHNSHFGFLSLGDHQVPFRASARDQGASLFARGQPDKNACYINIGTGAFIQRVSSELMAPAGLLVSPLWLPEPVSEPLPEIEVTSPTCYLEMLPTGETKNLYAWEATVNGAASATGYIQEQTALAVSPADITRALALEPQQECYFLNAVGGLSSPYWRTDLQSRFSANLAPDEKILAWLESIIFQIAVNVSAMKQLGQANKIYISGGLSNANAICQKIADLTQTAVIRSDNADATLQGIANMAGALSADWMPIFNDEVFQPKPNGALLLRFEQWQEAMTAWLIQSH